MKQKFFLANDSDASCNAIYDENRKLIVGWQEGDDISRVFGKIFSHLGISLEKESFEIDGGFPDKI